MDIQPIQPQTPATPPIQPTPSQGPKKGLFDANPKHAFIFGIIAAIAVLGLSGTIIFGLMYFNGSKNNTAKTGSTVDTGNPAIKLADVSDKDHIRGNQDAPITIIEYSDTECPFCKSFHPTMKKLLTDYPTQIRWVFRHFPIEQLHSKAPAEANAVECANEQGKFWEFLDKLYEVTPGNDRLDPAQLPVIAKAVGVSDMNKFNDCVSSSKYSSIVQADQQSGLDAGVQGTPASFINGEPVYGAVPYAQLKAGVDKLLKK